MSEKVEAISDHVLIFTERAAQLDRDFSEMRDDIREIKAEITAILQTSNRWRGGFIALAALGGISGWILTSWENIITIVRGVTGK